MTQYGTVHQDSNEPTRERSASSDHEGDSSGEDLEEPLLSRRSSSSWVAPRGFLWIEMAIFANVFLCGFDGTITASTYALISSDFNAANNASWLTTSYLITTTAFQPLYGRFSDIFGRRICFFISTILFTIGCLGCGAAQNIILLNFMRAVTGLGGGGLMTMATIINSDMIPFSRRGMYQALQNVLFGFGSICGASFGGTIADSIGWRWCFLLQVPISLLALGLGYLVVDDSSQPHLSVGAGFKEMWAQVDLFGSFLLILGLSAQLVGLSLGGNELPWGSPYVIVSLVLSVVILAVFLVVEAKTRAAPIIPIRMLQGVRPVATQIANICIGLSAYAYLFLLPLYFQVVLGDSAAKAGARLAIPSAALPVGGLITGIVMSRWGRLPTLVRTGCFLTVIGNVLIVLLKFHDSTWKYYVWVVPANLGTGMVYPAILFTFLGSFDHTDHAVSSSTVYLIRSLGTVWGVSITSAIVQTTLKARLPAALKGIPDKWTLIERIRHSVTALNDLPDDVQMRARLVYYDGIQLGFITSTAFAVVAVIASWFVQGKGLRRTTK